MQKWKARPQLDLAAAQYEINKVCSDDHEPRENLSSTKCFENIDINTVPLTTHTEPQNYLGQARSQMFWLTYSSTVYTCNFIYLYLHLLFYKQ